MRDVGRCHNTSMHYSFWPTLITRYAYSPLLPTRRGRMTIFDSVEAWRLHVALGYCSPCAFEQLRCHSHFQRTMSHG